MMSVMDAVGTCPPGEAASPRDAGVAVTRETRATAKRRGEEEQASPWSEVLMSLLAGDPATQAGLCGSPPAGAGMPAADCAGAVGGVTAGLEAEAATADAGASETVPGGAGNQGVDRGFAAGVDGLLMTREGGGDQQPAGVAKAELGSGTETTAEPVGTAGDSATPVGGEQPAAGGVILPVTVVNGRAAGTPAQRAGVDAQPKAVSKGTRASSVAHAAGIPANEMGTTVRSGGAPANLTAGRGARGDAPAMDAAVDPASRGATGHTQGAAGVASAGQGAAGDQVRSTGGKPAGDVTPATGVAVPPAMLGGGLEVQGSMAAGGEESAPEHGEGTPREDPGEVRRIRGKRQDGADGEVKAAVRPGGQFDRDLGLAGHVATRDSGDEAIAGGVDGSGPQGSDERGGIGEIGRQIVDRARILKFPERTEVEISLKPESLGKVVMRISMHGDRLSAKFEVSEPEVRSVLETRMDELRRGLSERGLEVQDLSVSVGDGTGAGQYGRDARDGGRLPQRTGHVWIGPVPGGGLEAVAAQWRNLDRRALDLMA